MTETLVALLDDALRRLWKAQNDNRAVTEQLNKALREKNELWQRTLNAEQAERAMAAQLEATLTA